MQSFLVRDAIYILYHLFLLEKNTGYIERALKQSPRHQDFYRTPSSEIPNLIKIRSFDPLP